MSDIQHTYHYDEETGILTRKDSQDVTDIIKQNEYEKNSGLNDQKGAQGRKFASVPLTVLEDLKSREGIDYMLFGVDPDTTVRLLRWFNDPANNKFRTSEAKLGNANRYLQ